jgi:hypothetical protein
MDRRLHPKCRQVLFAIMAGTIVTLVCACTTPLSQKVQPVQDFYDAASKLSEAEQQTYADIDAARVRLKRLEQEAHYLKNENFTLDPPQPLSNAAKLRFDATKAVQIYAQTLVRLTGDQPNKNIDSYTEDLASKIKTAWSSVPAVQGGGTYNAQDAGLVVAAFTAIANLAVDTARARKIQDAAAEAQGHLVALAALLKADDTVLSAQDKRLDDEMPTVTEQILGVYRKSYASDPGKLNDFFKSNTAEYDAYLAQKAKRAKIGDLADALVRANAVLAKDDQASFLVLAKDASRRASDAIDVFNTVKKQ